MQSLTYAETLTTMNTDQLVQDLIRDEGIRLKPYTDTVGKTTIGIGRNLDDVGITNNEAMILCRDDIIQVVGGLNSKLTWWTTLSEARQRVLANMAFNMGVNNLLEFKKMLAALSSGDYEEAAREMLNSTWATQVKDRAIRLAEQMRQG